MHKPRFLFTLQPIVLLKGNTRLQSGIAGAAAVKVKKRKFLGQKRKTACVQTKRLIFPEPAVVLHKIKIRVPKKSLSRFVSAATHVDF